LEFTAPTYWLRRHTKLRLVKHSPDTRPVSPPPSPHRGIVAYHRETRNAFDKRLADRLPGVGGNNNLP